RELEDELRAARGELETFRGKDAELSSTMASALRRANEIEEVAQERARTILAGAEEAASRTRSDASRRIDETGGQVNDVLRLKDNRRGAWRGAVGEFEEGTAGVERGEPIFSGRPARAQAPAPPPPPAAPVAPAPPPPSLASPPAVSPPVPTASAPPPPP